VTSTVHDPAEFLRDVVEQQFGILEQQFQILEEQFQRHTAQLSEFSIYTQQLDRGGHDEETLIALIISSREALADTAKALRRMAEGTYGTGERRATSIPSNDWRRCRTPGSAPTVSGRGPAERPASTSCVPHGARERHTRCHEQQPLSHSLVRATALTMGP
jgi:RNA polymerase-binding transcription factor DksA